MTEFGLRLDLFVNHYDLAFKNLGPDEAVEKVAKRFILERALIGFLTNKGFTFEDGSAFTVSELTVGVENMKKRLGIKDSESIRKRISKYEKS